MHAKPPKQKRVLKIRRIIKPSMDHPLKRGLFEKRLAKEMALAAL